MRAGPPGVVGGGWGWLYSVHTYLPVTERYNNRETRPAFDARKELSQNATLFLLRATTISNRTRSQLAERKRFREPWLGR